LHKCGVLLKELFTADIDGNASTSEPLVERTSASVRKVLEVNSISFSNFLPPTFLDTEDTETLLQKSQSGVTGKK
jgi:hypothetical protein